MVRRLFLAYLALLVLALAVFGVLAARATRARVQDEIERRLDSEAELVAALVRSLPEPSGLQAMFREMGRRADVRLTVIAADGKVMADSHADPSLMENRAIGERIRELQRRMRMGSGFEHVLVDLRRFAN